jgi:hypothetical protein
MRLFTCFLFLCLFANTFAYQQTKIKKSAPKNTATPCVKAFLNKEPLNCGMFVSKRAKGIITVTKDNVNKIYFNVTLKSNIGKKDEPPVYLRFIKQKSLDINELMEYAEEGDEIFIEEFVPNLSKVNLNCIPANYTVSNNL